MINSIVQARGQVQFPEFRGERIYMHEFYQNEGLPEQFAHWQGTVDAMLSHIDTNQPIYLMVDQAVVKAGEFHRRPGMHVDGYWMAGHGGHRISAHGGSGHGGYWRSDRPSHGGHPTHGGNGGGHRSTPRHSAGKNGWDVIDFSAPEGIILASNVAACVGYVGQYDEQSLGHGGDASHIRGQFDRIELEANRVYAGNVGMLHETVAVKNDCMRTVVRLNVPGWTPSIN